MPGSESRIVAFGQHCRRLLVVRRGSVRVVRGSSLGELMHQGVELALSILKLAVDQGEAFNQQPHMCGGGLGRAGCQLHGWRAQPSP